MASHTEKRLSETITEYLQYRQSRRFAEATMRVDRRILRRFCADVGDLQMRSLTSQHVSDWFYGPRGLMSEHQGYGGQQVIPPITAATHNQYRTRLSVFFTWCVKRGYLRRDLLEDVPYLRVDRKRRLQPPPDVLLQLLEVTENPRDRAYIAVALNTAMRDAEIRRLRVGDVDLQSGLLHVIITKTHEEDHRPITADLDVELRRWLTIYATDIGRPLRDDDYLLPSRTGGVLCRIDKDEHGNRIFVRTPYEWNTAKSMDVGINPVQRALKALGLPTKGEGAHTVRRGVARAFFDTQSRTVGYDSALRTVSALLNHKNTATTERYLGLTSEMERRDRMLRGQPFLTAMVARDNVVPLRKKHQQ